MGKYFSGTTLFLIGMLTLFVFTGHTFGAEQTSEYLKYQEPQTASTSLFSTIAYLLFLVVTFLMVIALAYFTSRFLGQKMIRSAGDNKILTTLSLGSNRAVYVVEVAGRVLVLGVTDHSMNLLQEITDLADIEKIKKQPYTLGANQFDTVFQKQLVSLQQMSRKFPAVFGNKPGQDSQTEDKEKR